MLVKNGLISFGQYGTAFAPQHGKELPVVPLMDYTLGTARSVGCL